MDYRHTRDTISELGETGGEDGRLATFGLFLPVSILLFISAITVKDSDHGVAMLALCIGIGYLVAVVAPCDPGSPMEGSLKQTVHNVGGAIEYLGGALSLWIIGAGAKPVFFYAGWLVASATIMISIPQLPWRGLVQRVVETTLFAAVIYGCWLTTR